ncbi:MAG: hypothetical protein IJD18_02525 [Clostridia bacterium]|nr:hypothetical protein [Clostridia bacterium]MBQ3066882.1 hypothetical protein [Clostridia bacterium]MBR2966450.1 hypothetical protein [Clostridia bacterium]
MNILAFASSASAWESFLLLFSGMSPWVILALLVGFALCIAEAFTPGFGVAGISGIVLILAGIVLRMLAGGNGWMLLYMVLFVIVMLALLFVFIHKGIIKGKLGKTAIFNVESSVSESLTEGTKDFSHLLGKTGTAQTALRPVGKVAFDDAVVDVVAREGFISAGATVAVVQVEGQRVVVVQK